MGWSVQVWRTRKAKKFSLKKRLSNIQEAEPSDDVQAKITNI